MSYSRLIDGLHLAGVEVDRKVLADLAVSDPEAFGALVATAQDALVAGARGGGRFLTQRLAFTHQRVRRLRGLLQKRSARWSRARLRGRGCRADPLRPRRGRAGRVGLRRARGRPRPRRPGRLPAGDRGRGPGLPPGGRGARAGGRHGHAPAGPGRAPHARRAGARRGGVAGPARLAGRGPGRRPRPGQRRHGAPRGRRLGVDARWSSPATRSTPTTPRPCAPRPARSSMSRCAVRPDPRAAGRRAVGGGLPHARPRSCGTARTTPPSTGPCPTALFLGNESAGLDPALCGALDGALAIPMAGRAESLNVGVACAVVCFEAFRQRRGGGPGARSIVAATATARHGD